MKNSKVYYLLLATNFLLGSASAATQLQGAGATFPAPLYFICAGSLNTQRPIRMSRLTIKRSVAVPESNNSRTTWSVLVQATRR